MFQNGPWSNTVNRQDVSWFWRGCGSCSEGVRCHAMESDGGLGSWTVPSWTCLGRRQGFSCGSHTPNRIVLHSQQLSFVRAASSQISTNPRFQWHLRVWKSLIIWCVTCLIHGCSHTLLLPWALPLLHLPILLHNENTHNIPHISKLRRLTSCAIKNHSGVRNLVKRFSWKNGRRRTITEGNAGVSVRLWATIRFPRDVVTIRARLWGDPHQGFCARLHQVALMSLPILSNRCTCLVRSLC